jgi:hypothetical protein
VASSTRARASSCISGNGYKQEPGEPILRDVIEPDADAFNLAYEEVLR